MSGATNGTRLVTAAAAVPLLAAATVLMIVGGAGANASPTSAVCGGAGTAQTIAGVHLDAEQLGNARTIVTVVADRHLPVYAAEIAVTTAYTESTLHNSTTQTDLDSEGLFQQRVSIYTAAVAADPVRATNAFLDRLLGVPNWPDRAIGTDAQAVQRSRHPERYQPNAALAEQLVGQLWPTATATIAVAPRASAPSTTRVRIASSSTPGRTPRGADTATSATVPAICAGAGGATPGGGPAGPIVGPRGGIVAGTTEIPAGLVISGSSKAYLAVRYALAQLGKPYVFAAAGPDAFDCSGLTMAAWAAAGVALPHLAAAQAGYGTAEPTDLSQAVGGDLVMIPGSDGTAAAPGHVGMVVGYVDRRDGRHLLIEQAADQGIPLELSEASSWLAAGVIVAVRHIA